MITGGLRFYPALQYGAVVGYRIVSGKSVGLFRDWLALKGFSFSYIVLSCGYYNLRKFLGNFGLCLVDKSSYRLSVGCFLRCEYNRNCIMFGDLNGVSWGDGGTVVARFIYNVLEAVVSLTSWR